VRAGLDRTRDGCDSRIPPRRIDAVAKPNLQPDKRRHTVAVPAVAAALWPCIGEQAPPASATCRPAPTWALPREA
jgi:hypothetical protein